MKKLEEFSTPELVAFLTYAENLAMAYKNVTGHIVELTKSNTLTNAECAVELQKLASGFQTADEATFEIEAELDRRMKKNLVFKYGTKTLTDIQNSIDQKVADRKAEEKKGKE